MATADDYYRALKQLLPKGKLFDSLKEDSLPAKWLASVAKEFQRVDARVEAALAEFDPRTATETLEDWERELGLPNELVPTIPATLSGRRAAVAMMVAMRGGQSFDSYAALCAAAGWELIEVVRFASKLLRANVPSWYPQGARVDDRVWDAVWAYTVEFRVTATDPESLPIDDLTRVIRQALRAGWSAVVTAV